MGTGTVPEVGRKAALPIAVSIHCEQARPQAAVCKHARVPRLEPNEYDAAELVRVAGHDEGIE